MKPTRDDLLAVIRELANKAVPKVAQRNAAYAGSGDVFGNLNLVETLSNGRLSTELGITLRMGDKVSRLYSLCSDPTIDAADESLEDTLIDLLGYSALLLLRHRTREVPTESPGNARVRASAEGFLKGTDPIWNETPTSPTGWRHDYAWDGTLPCTGSYRCRWCKKVADATGTDYSKVDYNEPCPGSPA